MKLNTPELVLPGGDLHRVKIAFLYGADAVYVGLNKHSLRKAEVRFNITEIGKAIELAHSLKKKLYVTFNIFAHNEHLEDIAIDMKKIAKFKPDAFIIADPGVINVAQKVAPKIPIHLSTQANTINLESVRFWAKQGIKRIVLAREATLKEIIEIKKAVPKMELEVFVHGAMCISYSGRCLMSSVLTGRSSNLGECTQPCRWPYRIYIEDPSRKNQLMEVESSEDGTYIMNSKDLCLIEHLDKLASYVDAMKVEGRNKTDFYLASVGRLYRIGLDSLPNHFRKVLYESALKIEADKITHRPYTTGFIFGDAKNGETFNSRAPIYGPRYVGYISKTHKNNWATLEVKNKVTTNNSYEVISPAGIEKIKIVSMKDKSAKVDFANPGTKNKKVMIEADKPLIAESFIREVK
jgi:putative protease